MGATRRSRSPCSQGARLCQLRGSTLRSLMLEWLRLEMSFKSAVTRSKVRWAQKSREVLGTSDHCNLGLAGSFAESSTGKRLRASARARHTSHVAFLQQSRFCAHLCTSLASAAGVICQTRLCIASAWPCSRFTVGGASASQYSLELRRVLAMTIETAFCHTSLPRRLF